MKRAVFIDRDGVILKPVIIHGIPRPPYNKKEFDEHSGVVTGALQALEIIKRAGFLCIMVTNQPDIRYGNITKDEWEFIHAHALLEKFDDVYICFHGNDDGCECKKPKPGMLIEAAKKWNIDLSKSFILGDTESDIRAGNKVGCTTILLNASYNTDLVSDYRINKIEDIDQVFKMC